MRVRLAVRLVLLAVGVLVTQLSALALNAATGPLPIGLDEVRRHPFRWAAILTGVLMLIAALSLVFDSHRPTRLHHELSARADQLGAAMDVLEWCHSQAIAVLEGSTSELATTAVDALPPVHDEMGAARVRLREAAAWAAVRGDPDAGTPVPVRMLHIGQSTVDARRDFVAGSAGSVHEIAAWLLLVRRYLGEVDDAFADLSTGLGACLVRWRRVDRSGAVHRAAVRETLAAVPSWRARVRHSGELLDAYLAGIADVPDTLRVRSTPVQRPRVDPPQ